MRVFVLNTGRCGSVTLSKACERLTNYTTGHESRVERIGEDRFAYPDQHVEIDNRLSWFLGGLERRFGDEPLYVHLRRDPEAVAASFANRYDRGIIKAFREGMIMRAGPFEPLDMCRFYVQTVTDNIETFLVGKPRQMTVWLENVETWLPQLWDRIGGQGDLAAAMGDFQTRHNAS
jgi:hypothetical protein